MDNINDDAKHKTIKVLSKNNIVYYTYDRDLKAQQSKDYYHSTCAFNKKKHTFYKNLKAMKKPHDKSLSIYKPSIEEITKIMHENILEDIEKEENIRVHFNSIIERMKLN